MAAEEIDRDIRNDNGWTIEDWGKSPIPEGYHFQRLSLVKDQQPNRQIILDTRTV